MAKPLTPELLDAARVCAAQFLAKDGTRPVRVKSKLAPAVVFLYTSRTGCPCILAFAGRAEKAAANYRFATDAGRRAWVEKWLAAQAERAAGRVKRKEERKASNKRALTVGDILRASWGYDQTNIDYYEVTKLIGSAMVEIRKIAAQGDQDGIDQGSCVPHPGRYIGEPMRKLAQGDAVRIYSFACARKISPHIIAGVKVWSEDRWTAYH